RSVRRDTNRRRIRLLWVPPQVETRAPAAAGSAIDWKPLFDAAGLDMGAYTPTASQWTPFHYADTRAAWNGPVPNMPGQTQRIEAAAYRGRPIYFQQIAPWTQPSRDPQTIAERRQIEWSTLFEEFVVIVMLAAAGLIARHNLHKGRGDRRGALHLARALTLAGARAWRADSHHFLH